VKKYLFNLATKIGLRLGFVHPDTLDAIEHISKNPKHYNFRLESLKVILRDIFVWCVFTICVLVSILSLIYDLTFGSDLDLFQRSGSILVASGAAVEISYSTMKFDDRIQSSLYIYKLFYNYFKIGGWLAIILGTIIWGYGDLLISWLKT